MLGRRHFVSGALWGALLAAPARSDEGPMPKLGRLTLGWVRPQSFCQLPLHLADRLGFIGDEGVRVAWQVFPDYASATHALHLGHIQVLSAPYSATFDAHRLGRRWTAFVLQSRTPQYAVGLSKQVLTGGSSPSGRRLSVAVPAGSQIARHVSRRALHMNRLSGVEIDWVDVQEPSKLITALSAGHLDGVCCTDPVMTQVERDSLVKLVADTRTVGGTQALFGSVLPSACLMAQTDFVKWRADQCRALTHAVVRALKWLQTAGLMDLSRSVDERFFQDDRALYLDAFQRNREAWSLDGVFAEHAVQQMQQHLARWDPHWAQPSPLPAHSISNQWAREAKQRFRA